MISLSNRLFCFLCGLPPVAFALSARPPATCHLSVTFQNLLGTCGHLFFDSYFSPLEEGLGCQSSRAILRNDPFITLIEFPCFSNRRLFKKIAGYITEAERFYIYRKICLIISRLQQDISSREHTL